MIKFIPIILMCTACGSAPTEPGVSSQAATLPTVTPTVTPTPSPSPSPSPSPTAPACKPFSGAWHGSRLSNGATLGISLNNMVLGHTPSLDFDYTLDGSVSREIHCTYSADITASKITLSYVIQDVYYNDFGCPGTVSTFNSHGQLINVSSSGAWDITLINQSCSVLQLEVEGYTINFN